MKTQLNVSIESDLKERTKTKNCPYSAVITDALEQWLLKNMTAEEVAKQAKEIQESAQELRLKVEASKITGITLKSEYGTSLVKENLAKNGFTDEEIGKIFEIVQLENQT